MKKFYLTRIMVVALIALTLCVPCLIYASLQDDLNLSNAQKAALKTLKVETWNALKTPVAEMRQLRQQIQATILSDDIDTDVLAEQIAQLNEKQTEITEIAVNAKVKGSEILTPEQRERMLEEKEALEASINQVADYFKEVTDKLQEVLDFFENTIP